MATKHLIIVSDSDPAQSMATAKRAKQNEVVGSTIKYDDKTQCYKRSGKFVNFGVGDLKASKRKVDCEFDREPGKGSTMPAMAPLTAQSERSLSRMSMRR